MSYSQHAAHTTNSCYFTQSYAKINLTLDVLRRRADGYHELATVMQTIDLYDTLFLTTADNGQVNIHCSQQDLSTDDNLAVRAAQAVRQKIGLKQGLTIELHKRIPVAAGLGGGSSNAAAILLALKEWWHLPLSLEDLQELAASLGSDVPFFLTGGLVLCQGRGEFITPLAPHWPAAMRWLLLLKPAISVSTASVFRNLPPSDYTDGMYSRTISRALENLDTVQPADLHNSLERNVLAQYPQVAQARDSMLSAGAPYVRLSGSGPTLFSSFSALDPATQVQQQLQSQGYEVYLTRAIYPGHQSAKFY